MLSIRGLSVQIRDKKILNGIDLSVNPGEIHAIMGPNGSGKSTLANVITGKVDENISGTVEYKGSDLLELDPEERALEGIFLAFQHPIENSWCQQHLLDQGGRQRNAKESRRA